VLPDFHISLNHDKTNLVDLPGKKQLSQCECSRFYINQCIPEQPNLVDFVFVLILWNYEMSNAWFQESNDWKLWHDGACVFSWTVIYCFRHCVGNLFSIQHFQAKVNGNIFCSSSAFRDKTLYIKGWKMSKSVSSLILFVFLKYNSCLLLYML